MLRQTLIFPLLSRPLVQSSPKKTSSSTPIQNIGKEVIMDILILRHLDKRVIKYSQVDSSKHYQNLICTELLPNHSIHMYFLSSRLKLKEGPQ
jgi:hypothetical protein